MLEKLNIQGFRKYKDFTVKDFGQINFILGNNNIGKTSILESIYAWACGQNAVPFFNIPLSRGRYSGIQQPYWVMEELLASVYDRRTIPLSMIFDGVYNGRDVRFEHSIYPSELLGEYDTSYKNNSDLISVSNNSKSAGDMNPIIATVPGIFQMQQTMIAKWDVKYNDNVISTDITVPTSQVSKVRPFKLAKYIDVLSHTGISECIQIYASLKREKELDEVVNEIRKVYPEVRGFDMIPYPDGSQSPISVIKEDRVLPLYACGDGIQRWFYILGAFVLYKNSIICIDEIDTGFHHEAQTEFSTDLIRAAVQNGVQLFITTHNIEFLDNFLKSACTIESSGMDSRIKVITMRETQNGLKVRTMNAKDAYNSREHFNLELR